MFPNQWELSKAGRHGFTAIEESYVFRFGPQLGQILGSPWYGRPQ